MALKQIRLELARSREFPEGSDKHGYEFFAPLKPDGHIDGAHFKELAQLCTVHKFWDGDDEHGQIVRTGDDKHFAFSYRPGDEDDEPFFKLARHAFKPGEYITLTEPDGEQHTFKVVWVRTPPAPPRR